MDSLPIAFGKQQQQATTAKHKKPRHKKANGGPSQSSHPQAPPPSAMGRGSNQTELGHRGAVGSAWAAEAGKRKEETRGCEGDAGLSSKRQRPTKGAGTGRSDTSANGSRLGRGHGIGDPLAEHMFEDPWARLPLEQRN
ncbi:hypothetical protein IAR50_001432 [Cryptococcus sp. DSM 104548]